MMEDLPSSVDVVVLGTGLCEAMVAAACARSGLTVLHMDESQYYGAEWASFNLQTFEEWVKTRMEAHEEERSSSDGDKTLMERVKEGEELVRIRRRRTIHNMNDRWTNFPRPSKEVVEQDSNDGNVREEESGEEKKQEKTPREEVEVQWRRFTIDLTPKILLARGDLVRTLCDSQVSAYAEFKLVDRLLGVSNDGDLYRIPCSRGEIFDTTVLQMREKRRLMKFLQLCMQFHNKSESPELQEYAERPFDDFLSSQGVEGNLLTLIRKSLSFLFPPVPSPTTSQCIASLCRFMDSVGTFGASPFLATLYGSGELPQCFARLCAVFGGLYCLGQPIEGVAVREGRVAAVLAAGQRIECGHVIISSAYAREEWVDGEGEGRTLRTVLITKGSVVKEQKERISLVNLSSSSTTCNVRLFEAGWECCLASKGYYVSHITREQDEESERKNALIVRRIDFEIDEGSRSLSVAAPSNVHVCRLPDCTADYDSVVTEAKAVFSRFWPDSDFLPRTLRRDNGDEEADMRMDEEEEEKKDGKSTDVPA